MPAAEIRTAFPSIEETAKRAGVAPSRTREIVDLAEGISDKGVRARGQRAVEVRAAKRTKGMRKRASKTAHSER